MPPLSAARLRLVRGLALAWLLTGHVGLVPRALAPWGGDRLVPCPEPLRALIVLVAVAGAVLVLAARHVRAAGLVLAATIVGLTLASEAYYANNRLFVAALLAVACIAPEDPSERALRAQAALVYLGAVVDKLLDAPFRAGEVVHALSASVAAHGPPGDPRLAAFFPQNLSRALLDAPSWVFVGLAWLTIALELALVVAYLRRSWTLPWLATWLHGGIYLVTGSPFGVFLHAALIAAFTLAPDRARRSEPAELAALVYASSPFSTALGLGALLAWVGIAARRPSPRT